MKHYAAAAYAAYAAAAEAAEAAAADAAAIAAAAAAAVAHAAAAAASRAAAADIAYAAYAAAACAAAHADNGDTIPPALNSLLRLAGLGVPKTKAEVAAAEKWLAENPVKLPASLDDPKAAGDRVDVTTTIDGSN